MSASTNPIRSVILPAEAWELVELPPELQGPAGLLDEQGRYVRFSRHALARAIQRCGRADWEDASRFLVAQWQARGESSISITNAEGEPRWHYRCPACELVTDASGALVRVLTVINPRGTARDGHTIY